MRIALAVFPLVLVSAACGDDESSTEAAVASLCDAMLSLGETVDQIAGADVDPSTLTADDVQSAFDDLQQQVEDVQDAEEELSSDVRDSLQSAFDSFVSSVEDVPSDATLSEAGAAVETARTEFHQAWTETVGELSCETTTT